MTSAGMEAEAVHSLPMAYTLVGVLAILIAFVSQRMRRLPLSEALLALVVGVLVGPHVLALLDLPEELRSQLMLEAARLLLAMSLMAVALRYPVRELGRIAAPVALLLVVVLPAMAAVTAGLAMLTVGVPVALALLLGACLSPTDPVLASSVVTGDPAERDLPARTRRLLSMESGANDGLAYPLVVIALAAVLARTYPEAIGKAFYAVGVAVVIGLALGALAGKVITYASSRHDADAGSMLVFTLILAVATLGAARLAGADGVLAVFVAGLAYNWFASSEERQQEDKLDEALNRYFVLPLFLLLGIELPWAEWHALGWAGLAFAVLVLLFRRLPLFLLLKRPLRLRWRDGVYLGWFGPIGVSALFYVAHAEHQGVVDARLWVLGTLVVTASTIAHGISSSPGRRLYAMASHNGGETHPPADAPSLSHASSRAETRP